MTYRFKPYQEIAWAVATAALIVGLQALLTLQPEQITDWGAWGVALGGGMLRAGAGVAIAGIVRLQADREEKRKRDEARALEMEHQFPRALDPKP